MKSAVYNTNSTAQNLLMKFQQVESALQQQATTIMAHEAFILEQQDQRIKDLEEKLKV